MSIVYSMSIYTRPRVCAVRVCRQLLAEGYHMRPRIVLQKNNQQPECTRHIHTVRTRLNSEKSTGASLKFIPSARAHKGSLRLKTQYRHSSTVTTSTTTSCRTHTCGDLRAADVSQQVQLSGWVVTKRTFGNDMRFMPLRDAYGTTQLTYAKGACSSDVWDVLEKASTESVISITGDVRLRPEGQSNDDMPTGAVEVVVTAAQLLGSCESLPFPLDDNNVGANMAGIRMERRYLALRSNALQKNIRLRAKVASATRRYLEDRQFVEIETPLLFRRTPEGAREFIVPARASGTFYALPQSPQQYKQVRVVSIAVPVWVAYNTDVRKGSRRGRPLLLLVVN
ncbi:hypothetical protein SARC_04254 [Sphaeroforma arctica JP610]|uniref:Uncharacterized protein n=1 Tax=Sphaeroforma arctica JP610 TaxID=667725 RepID=A0A0L0G5G7_9EUKA|nr:hypothetical protein SARC_04254 [Sphaeroforma arctica JP610]KNC83498.1 hypothetical protein SARC_04254 [Sphaeroforma arctica JP610]|eukprot:XP_014157400.1 hypothetical protein SARC_04254 [Sphaeroforma arctica JP610]